MKLWMQMLVMLVIAILVHIFLSGQVVLFGSLYRFGQKETRQSTGDLVYLQDKKVITQKVTEYSKVTNLQNDFSQTMKDIDDASIVFVPKAMSGADALLSAYRQSSIHGIAISHDGVVVVQGNLSGDYQAITRQGVVYSVDRIVHVQDKNISYVFLHIAMQKPILEYIRSFASWESPYQLGQFLLQASYQQEYTMMHLCLIRLIQGDAVFCSAVAESSISPSSFFFDSYGQIVGTATKTQEGLWKLSSITKQQHDRWLQEASLTTGLTMLTTKQYQSQASAITPLLQGLYQYPKMQGRVVGQLLTGELKLAQAMTGGVVTKIADKYPVQGRSFQALMQGIASGDEVTIER